MANRGMGAAAVVLCLAGAAAAKPSPGPRRSTPIALSDDGKLLLSVNPDDSTVSLSAVTAKRLKPAKQIAVGGDPQSVVIAPNNRIAYVANAKDGTVSVLDLKKRRVKKTTPVGAEPMAVALSPNGKRLYVANSSSNSLSVIDTKTGAVVATADLSAFGTAPRAIAITNDGDKDDTDETVFVALFFAQTRPGKGAPDEGQDDQKEGVVVAISAATNVPEPVAIRLQPLSPAGFNANGKLAPATGQTPAVASTNPATFTSPTGCFPNQLASLAIRPGTTMAYVVSTAASPNGPLRFNSMAHGLVSVFDTATKTETTATQTGAGVRSTAPLNLNQGVNLSTTPSPRLFHTNPVAIAWRPDGTEAWIVIQQADTIVRMTVDAAGIPTIAAPLVAGPSQIVRVDLSSRTPPPAVADVPRGIAIDKKGAKAYVWNYASRTISTVDLATAAVVASVPSSPLPGSGSVAETLLRGAALFHTGRGPQGRMASEAWGSCATCHPQGRSDNVTWMFDGGPRQTISLDGVAAKDGNAGRRILNWSATRDEVHDFELNTRGVFGGRGLIDDDRVFFAIGGATDATPTDSPSIEQFHQFTGTVGTTDDLTGGSLPGLAGISPRRDFATATLPDGRVYILGGRSGPGDGGVVPATNAVLLFDPKTGTLTAKSSAGFTLRHSLGAAAVLTRSGPRIYAIGGYPSAATPPAPSSVVEEYDPAADTWRTVASLPTAVAQFGIAVAGGINTAEPLQVVHVVSGNTGSEAAPSVAGPQPVQRFQADPSGPGTWSTFTVPGLTPRRNHGCAAVLRGNSTRVFSIGGQDAAGTVLDTAEEYLAQTVVLVGTPHTSMPAARTKFGIAGSLSTNQIYIVGGLDVSGAPQSTVFEYSVATNGPAAGPAATPSGAWTTRANLAAGRFGLALSSPPPVTNFVPVQNSGRSGRMEELAFWVENGVRPARATTASDAASVAAGRAAFAQTGLVALGFSCATCHGGPKWTRSERDYPAPPSVEVGLGLGSQRVLGAELRQTATQDPTFPFAGVAPGVLVNVGTFTTSGRTNEIRANPADVALAVAPLGANGFNIPSLLSVGETAPYFYNGIAPTLAAVLDGSTDGNGGTRHHFVGDPVVRANLIAFLRSIDATTSPIP